MSDQTSLSEWRCASCGETHDELPAVTLRSPDVWFNSSEQEQADQFDLTTDTCIWKDEHFFVRGVLQIPLVDREGTFDFGVWTTLSRENFSRYMELYESPKRASLGPMFGWFSNKLPGYPETTNLKCNVYPCEPGSRPVVELELTDHPLSVQQREGVRFEDAVAYCHEHLGL
jgi:hypothetical protein